MTTTQIKNRGFTLVELLIVIVIIAILTVVSLVAYNGLQNQAKTSAAKSAAETVGKKAELYNTEEGSYPKKLVYLTGGSDGATTVTVDSGKSYYLTPTSVEVPHQTPLLVAHQPKLIQFFISNAMVEKVLESFIMTGRNPVTQSLATLVTSVVAVNTL